MLRHWLAAGTALITSSAASAQSHDWSGFYAGVHVARDWSHADWRPDTDQLISVSGINVPASASGGARGIVTVAPSTVAFPRTSAGDDRGVWGGQLGWTHQAGSWVFGIEADIDAGHHLGSATSNVAVPNTPLEQTRQITINRSIESRWSWSVRGRAGYAWDRFQLYAAGGVAGANVRISGTDAYLGGGTGSRDCFNPNNTPCYSLTSISFFTNTTTGSETRNRLGWTAGGGLEVALGHGFSIGLDARHTDLGRRAVTLPAILSQSGPYVSFGVSNGFTTTTSQVTPTGPVAQAIPSQTPISITENEVSLRLNTHFGGLDPDAGGGVEGASGPYRWTGFYFGMHGGNDWRRATTTPFDTPIQNSTGAFIPGRGIVIVPGTSVPGPDATLKSNREIWGAQAGYAHQWGNWVVGLEADISGPAKVGSDSVSTRMPLTAISTSFIATDSRAMKSRWSWAGLARVGLTWDRLQLYADGGVAGARLQVSGRGVFDNPGGEAAPACVPPGIACSPQTINGPFVNTTTGSASHNRIGWATGGGAEWALTDELSLGLDFRHTDLGKATYAIPYNAGPFPAVYTGPPGATDVAGGGGGLIQLAPTTYRYSDNAVTLRVNLHFGRPGGH